MKFLPALCLLGLFLPIHAHSEDMPVPTHYKCGLSQHRFAYFWGITGVAAKYRGKHGTWPTTRDEFLSEADRTLGKETTKTLFSRISFFETRVIDDNLRIDFRYRYQNEMVAMRITCKPKPVGGEILVSTKDASISMQ